ncbi:MAG: hypothetical protein E7E64_05000 [Clostridium celatum]|uniref:hypothetical protein n=1 Tax=Clostridium tertium TaxID=1559 RepID=UPI002901407E|nr:hypothetical protein [Clostridium celatum]
MINRKYIQEIIKNILLLENLDSIVILNSANKLTAKDSTPVMYSIYINPRIKIDYFDIVVENTYPFTHHINNDEFLYNNLLEEEIDLIEKILVLLDIKVHRISEDEILYKKNIAKEKFLEINKLMKILKSEVEDLRHMESGMDLYYKEKAFENIEKQLNDINIFLI